MSEERRINIRVPAHIFEDWDNARHQARTSWQELGMRFFSQWFSSQSESEPKSPLMKQLLGKPPNDDTEYALALLAWLRNPRLDAQRPFGQFVLDEFERERKRGK